MQSALFGIILTALVGSNAEAPISESYPDSLEATQLKRIPVGAMTEQIDPSTVAEVFDKPKDTWDQLPECPDFPPQRIKDISDYKIPGAKPFFLEEGRIIGNASSYGGDINWKHNFYFSDFGFLGQVTESEYHCLTSPTIGVESFAFVEFKIIDSYWGTSGGNFVVDTRVIRPEGCITYQVKDFKFKYFKSFNVGETYLILGRYEKGRQSVLRENGVFWLEGNEFAHPDGTVWPSSEIESYANQMSRLRSLRYQSIRSDLICEAIVVSPDSLNDLGHSQLKPVVVYKGDSSPGTIKYERVSKRESPQQYFLSSRLKFGNTYLLFLVEHKGGAYRCLRGWHSTFLVIEDCLFTRRKDYFGKRQDVLKEIKGYLNDP